MVIKNEIKQNKNNLEAKDMSIAEKDMSIAEKAGVILMVVGMIVFAVLVAFIKSPLKTLSACIGQMLHPQDLEF
jgi:hypothetical protein